MKAWTAIWLDVFLAIAVGTTLTPVQAQVAPPTALPPDVTFGRFIALIRGHLLTGNELVSRRQWDAAYPHFSFPTEEIYGVIREDLGTYRTPPFDGAPSAVLANVSKIELAAGKLS